mmetsp:Transcript_37593/g.84619  ORF Transcript_37593/g.84619 Transcript_37593/m.84619 type:complete len:103 (+) Transcript_37593:245-553(+)
MMSSMRLTDLGLNEAPPHQHLVRCQYHMNERKCPCRRHRCFVIACGSYLPIPPSLYLQRARSRLEKDTTGRGRGRCTLFFDCNDGAAGSIDVELLERKVFRG